MMTEVTLFLLVMARVSVFVAFFPLFTQRQLPAQVKVGLAAALSIFWLADARSSFTVDQLDSIVSWWFALLLLKEMLIGIILAFVLGLFFYPAKIAGSYVAQELGLSLAAISDPGSQDSSTLVSRLFEAFAILLFFALNLHHFVILSLHFSFEEGMTRLGFTELPTEVIVTSISRVSDYGLLEIAPLLIVLMLVTLVLGFLNRAAPALNLFSVGMTVRVGLGGFLLFVFSPIIFGAMEIYFYRVQEDIEWILRSMTS
ncbi:MAG: flagellar biosynthetic protein FliR [Planctomycetota bacterium]